MSDENRKNCCERIASAKNESSEVFSPELANRARNTLEQHAQFRGRASRFAFALCGDVLVVRGTVPTYYLKQLLQSALKDLNGVRQIDNRVVVTATTDVTDSVPQ
jgi:hypothetical protein